MTKKHYITIAICSMITIICAMLYISYYKQYIAPKSYVIGGLSTPIPYKELEVASYLTSEDVLFSMDINKQSFSKQNEKAVFEYNFEHTDFNGTENTYSLFVNNDIVLSEANAGTISATHVLKFYDVDKECLTTLNVDIDFAFYSLSSNLKVSLNASDLGYLMKYFKTESYVITLTKSVFELNKTEYPASETSITLTLTNTLSKDVTITSGNEVIVIPANSTKEISVKSTGYIFVNNVENIDFYLVSNEASTTSKTSTGITSSWVNKDSVSIKIRESSQLRISIWNYYANRLEMVYANETMYIGNPYTSSSNGSAIQFNPSTYLTVNSTDTITFTVPTSVEITSTGNVKITRTTNHATVSWTNATEEFSIQIGSVDSGPIYGT